MTYARLQEFPYAVPENVDQGIKDGIYNNVKQIETIFNEAQEKSEIINNNTDLTTLGKQNRLRQLSGEIKQKLDTYDSTLNGYRNNLQQITNSMNFPEAYETGDVVGYLKEKEIRDLLYEKDPLEVGEVYRQAVNNGDLLIMQAIERAPTIRPLLSSETIEKLKDAKLRSIHPSSFKKYLEVRTALKISESAIKQLEKKLIKIGINVFEDSLKLVKEN